MPQQTTGDFDIVPGSTPGETLAAILNRNNSANITCHSGATAPTYKLNGMLWLDTASSVTHILKYYNVATTAWISLLTVTTATGVINLITATPVATTDATNKVYVDDADDLAVHLDGSRNVTGDLTFKNAGSITTITLQPTTSGGGDIISFKDSGGVERGTISLGDTAGWLGMLGDTGEQIYLKTDVVYMKPNLRVTRGVGACTVHIGSHGNIGDSANLILEDLSENIYFKISANTNNGDVSLTREDGAGTVETVLDFDSDGITCDGKVNGASLHATNGFTGTFPDNNGATVTVVDGIITSVA